MADDLNAIVKARIERIKRLAHDEQGSDQWLEAGGLALTVLHVAGASLEDALRRLCDAQGIAYEAGRTTISKLQTALYQPAKKIEVISASENKQITAWGDT